MQDGSVRLVMVDRQDDLPRRSPSQTDILENLLDEPRELPKQVRAQLLEPDPYPNPREVITVLKGLDLDPDRETRSP
jgi:hypothetical protein